MRQGLSCQPIIPDDPNQLNRSIDAAGKMVIRLTTAVRVSDRELVITMRGLRM
jgi:hypothetical protein